MKRNIRIFAVLIALLLSLTACAFAEETPRLAGGWTICEDGVMTEDAQRAFDIATAELSGSLEIKAVRLLGTQVVAGVNYSVLALNRNAYEAFYSVLTIYADLQGGATVLCEETLPLGVPRADAEEDGQNPVMNFIGQYVDKVSQRAVLTVSCLGDEGGLLEVEWGSSASDGVLWSLPCTFDSETGVFTYTRGTRLVYTCDEEGHFTYTDVRLEEKGTFVVQSDDSSLAWYPEGEDADVGCVFEWAQ